MYGGASDIGCHEAICSLPKRLVDLIKGTWGRWLTLFLNLIIEPPKIFLLTSANMVLTVAIIGGGIAGLSAAIALRQLSGVDVQVYERAKEFKELGALIGLAPNGLRTLEKLGVEGVLTDEVGWRSPNGVPMCFK